MAKGICSVEACDGVVLNGRGWCAKHYKRWKRHGDPLVVGPMGPAPRPVEERFWEKVNKNGPIPAHRSDLGPCWLWAPKSRSEGYGRFKVAGQFLQAHRFAYELVVGQIPEGLTIDHLCRVRGCVNPGHMEPVPNGENVLRGEGLTARQARQTHCKRGHSLSGDNLYVHRGMRHCRICKRERQRLRAHGRLDG